MKKRDRRQFSASQKQLAVKRMAAGESVSAMAREYGVERSRLYDWKARSESGIPFSEAGRPKRNAYAPVVYTSELDGAYARIQELEQKIGRQQMANDFLRGALLQVNRLRRLNNVVGATASSVTSVE
ncbi:MAG: transposase [Acidobacteriota bacterium]|nr:transposase [Acidobacteriota bacterium]